MKKTKKLKIFTAAAVGLLASLVSAQTVIVPIGCTLLEESSSGDGSTVGPYLEPNPPVTVWDGSGIISNASLIADGAPVPAIWPDHEWGYSSARTARVRDTAEAPGTKGNATFTFDLGVPAEISGLALWNHSESLAGATAQGDRAIQTAFVWYSEDDGLTFDNSGEVLTFTREGTNNAPVAAQVKTLASPLSNVTHIRLVCSNFSPTTQAIVGFAEIRFTGNIPSKPLFIADPIVKDNAVFGADYVSESQSMAGSATNTPGDTIFYDKVGGPDWLVVATNGDLSGIADVVGTNEFSIKAITGEFSTIGSLQIIVDVLGNAPEFTMDPVEKADGVYNEDYASQSETLDGSATDLDGDTLIYSRAGGGPGWLNVASNGALSGVCNVLGTNSFPIMVEDGNGGSDTATLVIFVPVTGNAPVFTVDPITKADVVFSQDYALFQQTLAGSATDLDGDTLTYSKDSGPDWLIIASNGALTGVAGAVGTNSFNVVVDDGNGNTDSATLLIYVEPAPVGDLIMGMDAFSSGTAPVVTFMSGGISATALATGVGGNWATGETSSRGSSKDGTWGTHEGPPIASTNTTGTTENFTLTNGKTDGEITFTISNVGAEDIELGQFHFDAVAFRPNAARTYALNVLAGSDVTEGNVYTSAEDAITSLNGGLITDDSDPLAHDQHDDIDISLKGLADNVLEVGGTVILQIAFSDGTGAGGGHHLFVDNIGLSAAGADVPPPAPLPPVMTIEASGTDVIVSWSSPATFQLQTRPNMAIGDWADVPGATSSPATVPATMDAEFLRLNWVE